MNKIKYFIVFVIFFISLPLASKVFDADEFYLANGLRVIMIENHKAPIAKMMLWYKVGSIDEPNGKSGLAHLLEHLMFRGTKDVSGSRFNDIMLKNGVEFNAFTSHDFTVYHSLFDISRLELVLALEADRMSHLNIDDQSFERERKIVYEERLQRIENNPKSRFQEEVNKIFWDGTPYAHPIAGLKDDINNLTKEDAVNFYKHFYAPNNAVLIISGDVDLKSLYFLVYKYFNNIPKIDNINQQQTFSDLSGQYFIKKSLPDIQNIKISQSYLIPPVTENLKESFALMLFSSYLGEGGNSFLKRELVKSQKMIAANSSINILSRNLGFFAVSILPFKEDDDVLIEKSINKALQSLTPAILEQEKKKMLSWLVYIKDNPSDAAYIVGLLASLDLTLEQIENYASNLEYVTLEDVKLAVSNMLHFSRKITAVLTPTSEKEDD